MLKFNIILMWCVKNKAFWWKTNISKDYLYILWQYFIYVWCFFIKKIISVFQVLQAMDKL